MARSGDVLEIPEMGVQVRFVRTAADTDGELTEVEVTGRARGLLTQEHVHTRQTERLEPVTGSMRVVMEGTDRVIGPGDVAEIPPGTPHRQIPVQDGTVRLTVRPSASTEAFLERLARYSREGRLLKGGWPRPTAVAEIVRDFGDDSRPSGPPEGIQRAMAGALLAGVQAGRVARDRAGAVRERAGGEYVFVDEWDVAAPPEAVFAALADARTYPVWWSPVYLDVDADGPPALGTRSRQHFKGRLPYHLHTRSAITRLEPPLVVQGDVEGDLRGRGTWTLTPTPAGTHVRFDWRVFADRPLLKALTPLLRPLLRWNHAWAIARAMEGLEPYAQRTAEAPAAAPARGVGVPSG